MSILTEEEIKAIHENDDGSQEYGSYRAIESAVLAKLAGMALPEPAGRVQLYDSEGTPYSEPTEDYTADQLHQAFAQGAASQLSAIRTLEHLGYTNCGGEYWKPPLGKK